ncbi:hypothetical protein [Hymenobacter koreensis]|uniref:Uncharacterized protein n=1 Tax=Hymenobacter koreensis TaxID=1084523 RepID=A0ABP8JJQ8_9BACT
MTATLTEDFTTGQLVATDTGAAPVGAVRRQLLRVPEQGPETLVGESLTAVVRVPLPSDGAYAYRLRRVNPTTDAELATSPVLDYLATAALRAAEAAQYVRHARHARLVGPDTAHRRLWSRRYEARAAFAEQNGATAHALTSLPGLAAMTVVPAATATPTGLPWPQAGVYPVVERATGRVTVYFDVATTASVTATVQPFPATSPARPVAVTPGDPRFSLTFPAPQDGPYIVRLRVNGLPLATVVVLVDQTAARAFRELNRLVAAPQARRVLGLADAAWRGALARLRCAVAAADLAQPQLADTLRLSARPLFPTGPTALYPLRHA